MSAAASFSLPDIDPSIPTTIGGVDKIVGDWVAQQLGLPAGSLDPCAGIGVAYRDRLIAGVAFNNYRPYPDGGVIDASIAATTPRWATRQVLRDFFSYPFIQSGVTRLQVSCRKSNKHARKFVTRLGFRMEGVGRRMWDGKHDAAVYSMMPEECRWIDG